MKKLFTLFTGLCLICSAAISQLSIGPKAGLSYTTVSTNFKQGDKPSDWSTPSGIGWHFGAYLNINFSDKFAFRPELVFNTRRTKTSNSIENQTTKIESELRSSRSFIEVPLLLAIGNSGKGIQLHVGPSLNFLGGAKSVSKVTTTTGSSSVTIENTAQGGDATKGESSFELGGCAGLVFTSDSGFNVGLRYNRGLTSINSDNKDVAVSNYNVFQLSLGFTIGGK